MNDLATATWASVIIATVLVIVTMIFYIIMALQNRKMLKQGLLQISIMQRELDITIKEKERPRIVELIQYVLSPLVSSLLAVIEHYKNGEINYCEELSVGVYEEYFNHFLRKFPKFHEMIEEFNDIVNAVNQKLDGLMEEINTPNFRGKCYNLIVDYNKISLPEERLREDYATIDKDYSKKFALLIVRNNRGNLGGGYIYSKFWEKYGDELLKSRQTEKINAKLLDFERIWKKYGEKAEKLKETLEEQRENYAEEYRIPREDFWPKQQRLFV